MYRIGICKIRAFNIFSKNALAQDANVKKVISEQTAQWSAMMERQRKEEWELLKNQTHNSRDELKRLIEVVQGTQVKQLQTKHDKLVLAIYLLNGCVCKFPFRLVFAV